MAQSSRTTEATTLSAIVCALIIHGPNHIYRRRGSGGSGLEWQKRNREREEECVTWKKPVARGKRSSYIYMYVY